MSALNQILLATRADLLDGFPAKAVISAFRSVNPQEKLNDLLAPFSLMIEVLQEAPANLRLNPHALKHGIISTRIEHGQIKVSLLEDFFIENACLLEPMSTSIVTKALMFQSVCIHQLIHKLRGHSDCILFTEAAAEQVVNSDIELEAIAASLAHDLKITHVISTTGFELIQDLSPRLASVLDSAYLFASGSIIKLHNFIKDYS